MLDVGNTVVIERERGERERAREGEEKTEGLCLCCQDLQDWLRFISLRAGLALGSCPSPSTSARL